MSSWRNKPIHVRALLVPRFLWTTASIDVFLGPKCILQTGGQTKLTASCSGSFTDDGVEHQVELSWGHSRDFRFPYQLRIDGVAIESSHVSIDNRYLIGVPELIMVAVLISIFGFVFWLVGRPKKLSEPDPPAPWQNDVNNRAQPRIIGVTVAGPFPVRQSDKSERENDAPEAQDLRS